MSWSRSIWSLIIAAMVVGCSQPIAPPEIVVRPSDSDWHDRNADIYRFLFAKINAPISGRICFITTTPRGEWGKNGLKTIPADQLASFPHALKYLPAKGAYLKDNSVFERGTNAEGWMHWISVTRWISDTEVEIEEGVWCCPLGGGASTTIYEKVDGEWQVKKHLNDWVS